MIFIKYLLVTFTNKQRRIIFKFDVLYVEQLSPSSFIYISKPFSFFFFPAFASLAKLLCRFLPFSAVSAIFFPTYYISVRPYGRCLGNLRLSILLSAFLLHCNKNFLSSRPVNSSSFARSSTRKSPKICHAFFCGIVKGDFRVLIPLSSKRGPLQNLSYGKEFYLHGVYMIISRSKAPDTASV